MKEKIQNSQMLLVAGLIVAAVVTRFIPHPPNFTPIAAMALFGGAYYSDKRLAFLVPMIAMFISDLVLGLHQGMLYVYVSFAAIVGIGMLLKNRVGVTSVAVASLTSSVLFFVVTNFGMWLSYPLYTKDLAGLAQAYIAAIPFFQNTILGDLMYSGVMFGAYELAKSKLFVTKTVA